MIKDIGLNSEILDYIKNIFHQYPIVNQVKLYGSRAKGNYTNKSDIDLVAFGENIDRFIIAKLLLDFDDSDIPYHVDLQNYDDLKNIQLIEHIDRVGIVIYQKV
jgi:predicted nucleotidyltransferase